MAGWHRKGLSPKREEGRAPREARRYREAPTKWEGLRTQWFDPRIAEWHRKGIEDSNDQHEQVEGRNVSVPAWRDGTEKGRPVREKKEERREKREDGQHEGRRTQWLRPRMARWHKRGSARREKREERRETREGREACTMKMRGYKDAVVRSQKGGMVPKRFGPE